MEHTVETCGKSTDTCVRLTVKMGKTILINQSFTADVFAYAEVNLGV